MKRGGGGYPHVVHRVDAAISALLCQPSDPSQHQRPWGLPRDEPALTTAVKYGQNNPAWLTRHGEAFIQQWSRESARQPKPLGGGGGSGGGWVVVGGGGGSGGGGSGGGGARFRAAATEGRETSSIVSSPLTATEDNNNKQTNNNNNKQQTGLLFLWGFLPRVENASSDRRNAFGWVFIFKLRN
ncbi:unnamed protein product [Lampetra fluviatilis]